MGSSAKLVFRPGDMVRIKEGPFAAFSGRIEGINQSKSLLKVAVNIFGRRTPIKLLFSAVEKLQFEPHSSHDSGQNDDLNLD